MAFRTLYTAVLVAVLASSVASAPALSLSVSLCQALHATTFASAADEAACQKVLAQVGAGQASKPVLATVNVASQGSANANAFVNFMSTCNSLAGSLSANLSNALTTTLAIGTHQATTAVVSANSQADSLKQQVTLALSSLMSKVEASVGSLENIAPCTDAKVAATTYQAFGTFVNTQQKLLALVSANASLWTQIDAKESLHANLIRLQADLNTYVAHLFKYISADLDSTLNLRATLSSNVQRAIDSCA